MFDSPSVLLGVVVLLLSALLISMVNILRGDNQGLRPMSGSLRNAATFSSALSQWSKR